MALRVDAVGRLREEVAFNLIVDCWEYHPGLNKNSFTPSKLTALPPGIEVLAYTDSSITFKLDGWRFYGSRMRILNGWEFEKEVRTGGHVVRTIHD
jgi:hypothetical protein